MFELVKLLVKVVNLLNVVTLHALLDEVGFLIYPDLISFSQILSLTLQRVFFKISFLVRLLIYIDVVKKFNFLADSNIAMPAWILAFGAHGELF